MPLSLGKVVCHRCGGRVARTDHQSETLPETDQFRPGMARSEAECARCGAKYWAWVTPAINDPIYGRRGTDRENVRVHGFYDLSFRSTFSDQPGEGDLPVWHDDRPQPNDMQRQAVVTPAMPQPPNQGSGASTPLAQAAKIMAQKPSLDFEVKTCVVQKGRVRLDGTFTPDQLRSLAGLAD